MINQLNTLGFEVGKEYRLPDKSKAFYAGWQNGVRERFLVFMGPSPAPCWINYSYVPAIGTELRGNRVFSRRESETETQMKDEHTAFQRCIDDLIIERLKEDIKKLNLDKKQKGVKR